MARNIIDLICNSCSCSKEEAQEYLNAEVHYLQQLQEAEDLREEEERKESLRLILDIIGL